MALLKPFFLVFLPQGSPGTFGEKDDFSDLPPNQRRKKLQAKIEEITAKVFNQIEDKIKMFC